MPTSAPLLTDRQWARIERHLPAKKRKREIVSALVFRRWSGSSLRHVAGWYDGITVARLQSWEQQLLAGGELPVIMKQLKLPEASPRMWSSGGQQQRWRNADMANRIVALRFTEFREALRAA
jgi:hypothetical protein